MFDTVAPLGKCTTPRTGITLACGKRGTVLLLMSAIGVRGRWPAWLRHARLRSFFICKMLQLKCDAPSLCQPLPIWRWQQQQPWLGMRANVGVIDEFMMLGWHSMMQ